MAVTAQNPYCTVEEVLEELKRNSTDAPEGSPMRDKIQRAINDASRFVDQWCGRDFFLHDHSSSALVIDEHDELDLGDELWLPFGPVISIDDLSVGGDDWVEGVDFVVKDDSEPVGSQRTRMIAVNEPWSPSRVGDRLIEITGKFGYDQGSTEDVPTALPTLIARATRMAAALLTGDLKREFVGLDGAKTDLVQTELPKMFREILGQNSQEVMT